MLVMPPPTLPSTFALGHHAILETRSRPSCSSACPSCGVLASGGERPRSRAPTMNVVMRLVHGGVDEEHVGFGRVGDEGLAAVEDVVVAVVTGVCGHAQHIGARHPVSVMPMQPMAWPLSTPGRYFSRCSGVAAVVEVVHEEDGVGQIREGEAGVALRRARDGRGWRRRCPCRRLRHRRSTVIPRSPSSPHFFMSSTFSSPLWLKVLGLRFHHVGDEASQRLPEQVSALRLGSRARNGRFDPWDNT